MGPIVSKGIVFDVTIVYALLVFGGGLYGYIAAKSKASLIASTICAVIALLAAEESDDITPWPAALWCLLLAGFFGKKFVAGDKKDESMCPAHNSSLPAMTDEKQNDPMAKYTRMQDAEPKKKPPIMIVLALLSL